MYAIVFTASVGNFLRSSVCKSPTVLEAEVEVLWSGMEVFMMIALNIECR
jgi:hypothetical protein